MLSPEIKAAHPEADSIAEILFNQLLILSEEAEKHKKFMSPEIQLQIASEMRHITERIESLWTSKARKNES